MAPATDPFGRPTDFASWYRHLYPQVVALLTVTTGDADVAREAAAEAFVRAYERWDRVRKREAPGAWLYKVALDVARRKARQRGIERRLLRRVAPGPSVADALPVRPDVWEALRSLTVRQRTAIALRFLLGLPEAEVARVMGVQRGTVAETLSAARRALSDNPDLLGRHRTQDAMPEGTEDKQELPAEP